MSVFSLNLKADHFNTMKTLFLSLFVLAFPLVGTLAIFHRVAARELKGLLK